MKSPLLRWTLLFAALFACTLQAQDRDAIKRRMDQRLPALDALRAQGAIGENNRGFTEVRQNTGNAASVSAAENSDRAAVYAAIAATTGTTADNVGRQRAQQIAKSSGPGIWIQAENGSWYKK